MIKSFQSHLGSQLLTYFVITSIFPLLILWLISSTQFTRQYEVRVKNQLKSLADIRALQVQSLISSAEFALDHIFTEAALENRLIAVLTIQGDWGSVIELLRRELHSEISEDLFEEIVIFDLNAQIIATSNLTNRVESQHLHTAYLSKVHLSFHTMAWQDSMARHDPILIVTVPIMDREENKVGYLSGQLQTSALSQIINGNTGFVNMSSMYRSSYTDQDHPVSEFISNDNYSHSEIFTDQNNSRSIFAYSKSHDGDAIVILQVPYDSALSATNNLKNVIVVVMVIAGLVGIIIGAIVTRNLTKPVTNLTHLANSIRQGDYSQRVKITSANEVGQLGIAFNEMAERIQDLLHSLLDREAQLEVALNNERDLVEMQSHFIRQTSHEFRTPLAIISAASQSLQEFYEGMDTEQRALRFDRIEGQVQHMAKMLDDILLIKKIEEGELIINLEQFQLADFLQEIVDEFETIDFKHNIICQWPNNDFEITADKKLLRQIMMNLVSNAVKYSNDDTNITITLEDIQNYAKISVADEGIGIPDSHKGKVFEAFQRAKNVGNIKGTGLGLSITKRAVEMHNGNISFVSHEEQGSTFVVKLPL